MSKRSMWDLEVQVNVANLGDPAAQPYMLSYGILELAPLQFFRNLPLPEEGDVLHVDLVEQQLSPWPVCGRALKALVEACRPLSLFNPRGFAAPEASSTHSSTSTDDADLGALLQHTATSLYPLLLCADALCLTEEARRGLDGLVEPWVARRSLLVYFMGSTEGGDGRQQREMRYVDFFDSWNDVNGDLMLTLEPAPSSGSDSEAESTLPSEQTVVHAADMLPMLRWAALELFHMLDVLCLSASLKAMAAKLVSPGKRALYGDKQWLKVLQGLSASTRLSAAARSILFTKAMLAGSFEAEPNIEVIPLPGELTMKKAVMSGFQLGQGMQLCFHAEHYILVPLAVEFD